MTIFYGAAIQGAKDRTERVPVHQTFIKTIKKAGFDVFSEHTTGQNFAETSSLLEQRFKDLPPVGNERTKFIRDKMIQAIESNLEAAVFEVSVPSLGTGIEIAHAYLRPRLGLRPIPVLALYESDYWPHKLSSMLAGIQQDQIPFYHLKEYNSLEDGCKILLEFLKKI